MTNQYLENLKERRYGIINMCVTNFEQAMHTLEELIDDSYNLGRDSIKKEIKENDI